MSLLYLYRICRVPSTSLSRKWLFLFTIFPYLVTLFPRTSLDFMPLQSGRVMCHVSNCTVSRPKGWWSFRANHYIHSFRMALHYGRRIVHWFALRNNGSCDVLRASGVLEDERGKVREMLCERRRSERQIASTSRSDKLNAGRIKREGVTSRLNIRS
jgi:hypothetical protein